MRNGEPVGILLSNEELYYQPLNRTHQSMMQTDLFITTPVLNAAATIDQTIQSVVSQAGPVRIRYHVQDGGSSDGTWERILQWQARLARGDWPWPASLCSSVATRPQMAAYTMRSFRVSKPCLQQETDSWPGSMLMISTCPGPSRLSRQQTVNSPSRWISWIGGDVSVLRDDIVVAAHDREIPTDRARRPVR